METLVEPDEESAQFGVGKRVAVRDGGVVLRQHVEGDQRAEALDNLDLLVAAFAKEVVDGQRFLGLT